MKELRLTEPQLRSIVLLTDFTLNYLKYRLDEKDAKTNYELCKTIIEKIEATPRNKRITDAKTIETILAALAELNKVEKLLIVSDAELNLIVRMVNGKLKQLQREATNEYHNQLIKDYKELIKQLI